MIGTMKFFAYYNRYLTVVVSAVLYCSYVTKGQIVAERPVQDAAVPGEQPLATVLVRFDGPVEETPSDVSIFNENTDIQIYNEDSSNDDRLDNALEAAVKTKDLIEKLRDGLNNVADVINFVGDMADLVSEFVPQMAIFSSAFSLFGALTDENEGKMTAALQEIQNEINKLNARFDELKQVIKIEICRQSIQDTFSNVIMPIRTAVQDIREGNKKEKKAGYESLEEHCRPTSLVRPAIALGHIKNYVLNQNPLLRDCHADFVTLADNRILFYRQTFVLPLMTQLQEVIQYEGICEGVNNKVSRVTQSNLQRNIRRMKDEFEDKEAPMTDNWILSFQNSYEDTETAANTTAAFADLLGNWTPSVKYRVFLVTGDTDHWKCVGCSPPLSRKDGYGIFLTQRQNGVLVVMWVRSDANPGGSVTWTNQNCDGSMCNRKVTETRCCHWPFPWIVCGLYCTETKCKARSCGSTQQTANQNLIANNDPLWKDMINRGAIFVHTSRKYKECIRWNCGGVGIPTADSTCIKEEEVLYDMNKEDYTICGDDNNEGNDVSIQSGCCGYAYKRERLTLIRDMVGDSNVQRLSFVEGEDFHYTVYVNRS